MNEAALNTSTLIGRWLKFNESDFTQFGDRSINVGPHNRELDFVS